jgi:hypothetical protein
MACDTGHLPMNQKVPNIGSVLSLTVGVVGEACAGAAPGVSDPNISLGFKGAKHKRDVGAGAAIFTRDYLLGNSEGDVFIPPTDFNPQLTAQRLVLLQA